MPLEIVTIPAGPVETNAYLVGDTTTGKALVIDAPYESAPLVLDEAAERGWTIEQIVIAIELEEAAMVDGGDRLRVFVQVVLPLAAPGLAATAIFAFLVQRHIIRGITLGAVKG